MTTEFDVAIVGGGPSGSAAAHYLATKGHSVLVCEKKAFPREKTCGDGLTPRAIKVLLEMGLGEQMKSWERVQGLRVHAAGRTLALDFPKLADWPNYGLVKPRKDLDKIVLDHAEAAGAKVLYETQVKEPLFENGTLVGFKAKRGNDVEEIRAHFTVCAEGAATKFARALGRERKLGYPMGFAIRQYFTSPMEQSGWFEGYLDIKAGPDALPGYGWVFPVGDGTVNVGVGLLSTFRGWRDVNLHHLQNQFVASLPADWEINPGTVVSKPRAGRLFMGGSVWPPHGPGFILVGDAAGMINPMNGEGIAYGYETGRIGGRHIHDALNGGTSASLETYTNDLSETYGPYYRVGRRFVKLIGAPAFMDKLVAVGMRSKTAMSTALILMANLEDAKGKGVEQRGLKVLKKIAELKS